jgi:hypothetical protein
MRRYLSFAADRGGEIYKNLLGELTTPGRAELSVTSQYSRRGLPPPSEGGYNSFIKADTLPADVARRLQGNMDKFCLDLTVLNNQTRDADW